MFRRMVNASTGKPRVSLITGSGSKAGIGRAIANIFVREGGKVVLSDLPSREQEGLQGVKELDAAHGEGTAMWTPLDVTKQEDWISAIKSIEAKFGPLDVCVLNAGYISPTVGQTKSLDQIDMAEFRKITEINEMGTILGLKYAAESMKRNTVEEWKSIVAISSIAGMTAVGGIPIGYTTSKWAIRGAIKVAAQLGAPLKIRANSIHPGAISTEMTSSLGWVDLKTDQLSAEAKMLLDSEAAIKRFGTPEEIANVALLLSSNEGSYITGQSYVVDVGLWYG